jgi:hypothetical protein
MEGVCRGEEMLNKCTETPLRGILQSITHRKSGRLKYPAAALLLLFLSCALWAQGGKEFIYSPDGKLLSSVSAEPTWLRFNSSQGFAGIDTAVIFVGNGSGLTIGLQWQFTAWGADQTSISYESQIGPLASNGPIPVNGQIAFPIPQDCSPGLIKVTAIRNANSGDWIQLSQAPTYMVRPPKPALNTFVSPPVLQLPASPGTQRVHSANMKNQSLVITVQLPQGSGTADYILPLNRGNPALNDNGGDWQAGPIHCSALSGDYSFISARNALDANPDATALWNAITSGPMTETVVACRDDHHGGGNGGNEHHGDGR